MVTRLREMTMDKTIRIRLIVTKVYKFPNVYPAELSLIFIDIVLWIGW